MLKVGQSLGAFEVSCAFEIGNSRLVGVPNAGRVSKVEAQFVTKAGILLGRLLKVGWLVGALKVGHGIPGRSRHSKSVAAFQVGRRVQGWFSS